MAYPLAGLRVLELRAGIAIATTGLILADAGAEVIKLEPVGGDASRSGVGHRVWNRGKASVLIDESDPRLASLLDTADVVLLGGSRSRIAGWSRGVNQIVASAPPYADIEPYAALPENDALASALCGILGATGAYRPGPGFPVTPTLSYAAGATLAAAVMAALYTRKVSGIGQEVTVPWPTIGAYLSGYQASESNKVPYVPGAGGADARGLSIGWRVYPAGDGWVGVACPNPTFFNRLLASIERTDLLADSRFEHAPFISPEHRDEFVQILSDAFRQRTKAEWTERFEQYGVPGAALLNRDQFVASELVRDNRMISTVEDPEVGQVRQVRSPVVLSGVEFPEPKSAPPLGADTERVLSQVGSRQNRRSAAAAPATALQHPLAGVRVLDFTGYLAGPTAGRLLVELGAEVIKVEPPEGEGFRGGGLSCVGINVGKRSIALDTRSEQGEAVLRRLIESADVLLHALIAGAPEKLGLDYESVKAINPRITYCWISGFGMARGWRTRPSFDLLLQALSGQMIALGSEEEPIYSSIPMADLYAAMLATYGIVLSLYLRTDSGLGTVVSTNQVASSMGAQIASFVKFDGMPKGGGLNANSVGRTALNRYYEVRDGWAILAIEDEAGWRQLLRMHRHELARWEEWERASQEPTNGELAARLAEIFGALCRDEVTEQLLAAGVPCAPVVIVRNDRIANRYFRELGVLEHGIVHDRFGALTTVANFFRFSETPARVPDMAQWVGDQNREVLRSLGYSDEECEQLEKAGVVAAPELRMTGI